MLVKSPVFQDGLISFVKRVIVPAFKSQAKYFTMSLNVASEVLELFAYLLFCDMTRLLAHPNVLF